MRVERQEAINRVDATDHEMTALRNFEELTNQACDKDAATSAEGIVYVQPTPPSDHAAVPINSVNRI